MKFNVQLSKDDLQSHRSTLESITTQSCPETINACLAIFKKTFQNELCPQCKNACLTPNHLDYYNLITKHCSICNCRIVTSLNRPDTTLNF